MNPTCIHCDEPVLPGDSRFTYGNGPVAHGECSVRSMVGSVAHLKRECSCYVPGATCTDPPGMTRRQAARAAYQLWLTQLDDDIYEDDDETLR